MTKAGCPINHTAIYRWEDEDKSKRRKITLNEVMTLSNVLNIPLDKLIKPSYEYEADELTSRIGSAISELQIRFSDEAGTAGERFSQLIHEIMVDLDVPFQAVFNIAVLFLPTPESPIRNYIQGYEPASAVMDVATNIYVRAILDCALDSSADAYVLYQKFKESHTPMTPSQALVTISNSIAEWQELRDTIIASQSTND